MANFLSNKTARKLRIIGIYQFLGGFLGIGFTCLVIMNQAIFTSLVLFIVAIMLTFFSYSIFCGILLIKKKKSGLFHSKINQYLQLFGFASYGYAYQFASGACFTLGIDLTNSFFFTFNASLSSFHVSINTDSNSLLINFNLVALFMILFIEGLEKKITVEELKSQISDIGI